MVDGDLYRNSEHPFLLYKLSSKDNMEDICGKLEAATPVGTTVVSVNIHKVHHILNG